MVLKRKRSPKLRPGSTSDNSDPSGTADSGQWSDDASTDSAKAKNRKQNDENLRPPAITACDDQNMRNEDELIYVPGNLNWSLFCLQITA